jgi:hypothetical protein
MLTMQVIKISRTDSLTARFYILFLNPGFLFVHCVLSVSLIIVGLKMFIYKIEQKYFLEHYSRRRP